MVRNLNQNRIKINVFRILLSVKPEDEINFAMLFPLRESRRTSDPALSRDRGSQVQLQP